MVEKFGHDSIVPVHEEWGDRYDGHGCVMCNRKVGNDPKMVYFYDGDAKVFANWENPVVNLGGAMGWYPVGNECAKKFQPEVMKNASEVKHYFGSEMAVGDFEIKYFGKEN